MDKYSQKIFSTGIRAVGAENDFYTLEKMSDPYCWEHIYANGVGGLEFITSDNPVMLVNNITGNARPFANGLLKIGTAVYYPISPKLLLCVLHPELTFGAFSEKDCCLVDLDSDREVRFISTINRKQIEQCSQHAFARSEDVLKQYAMRKLAPVWVKQRD